MNTRRLYSGTQAAWGSFIGGPVAPIWFVFQNYLWLRQPKAARLTLAAGMIWLAVLIAIIASGIVDHIPHVVIPLAYVFATRRIVRVQLDAVPQGPDANTSQYQSNWWVFGVSIAILALSGVVVYLAMVLLIVFKVIPP